MYSAKNPKKFDDDDIIDVIIEHPVYGEIPFTASPTDCMEYGREIHAKTLAGENGAIASLGKKPKGPK